MRLTSATRLRILTVFVASLLTFLIGFYAANHTYDVDTGRIDRAITDVTSMVAANPDQAIGAALFQVENDALDLLIILHSHDGEDTLIRDSSSELYSKVLPSDINLGINTSISSRTIDERSYRFATIEITLGDYLFIAADSSDVESARDSNLQFTFVATVVAAFVSFLIFSFYIRRVRTRDDADALARMQHFLGDASHELRTPLTVVKGYVEMLSTGALKAPEDRERAFNRVSSEIERMENLIRDLLLLAELGESADGVRESVELSEIVQSHSTDFSTLHPQRKVTINIESHVHVSGVADYVVRYVQNALTNIARHTPSDAPVTISLVTRNKRALLVIEDGGPGLPDSSYGTKVKLLNRFDKARSREHGGSGLGMSIMSGVIEKLGGTLTLRKSLLGGLALEADIPLSTSNSSEVHE